MNLSPLTLEIATFYGCDTEKRKNWYLDRSWSENLRNWTNAYATALGVRDLKFTLVDEDYRFDDDPKKIYLLRKNGKNTYYFPIHDRNLVTKQNEPMKGLFLSEKSIFRDRSGMMPLRPTYTTIFSNNPEGPGYGYSLEGYYIFKDPQHFMNWDEAPWGNK